jgi:rhodanese-related sulfurtransferase
MSSIGETVPDATASEAFRVLQSDRTARLVDVRTRAEWAYVGLPDLGTLAEPILVEWQMFPTMQVDANFGEALSRACPDRETALYFLCRSGVRSLAAAREMRARGYTRVFNVKDGFEGPPDTEGHRGTVAGWKASGLPWRQT